MIRGRARTAPLTAWLLRGALPWALGAVLGGGCATETRALAPPTLTPAASCPATSPVPLPTVTTQAASVHFEGGLLLPPTTAGAAATELTGCLGLPPTAEQGERFPAPVALRSASAAGAMRVTALSSGLVVAHDLVHACCLRAQLSAAVQGDAVVVTEALSGTPCRCQCSSTLRTAVGLPAGRYTVELRLSAPGEPLHPVAHAEARVAP